MTHLPRRAAALIPVALLACGLVTGCASFKGSKRVDLGPFSENTMGMVGELQKFNRPAMWTHLKKYQTLPSVQNAGQSVAKVRVLMRGVAFYSMQIASLSDSPLSEDRKISELARYMEEIIRPSVSAAEGREFKVSSGYMDTLVNEIRKQKTFLGALGAAQPLVAMTVSAGDRLFDRLDQNIQDANADLNERIEAEFGSLKQRVEELDAMHIASVHSYTLLQQYRGGNPAALDSIRMNDPGVREYLPIGKAVSSKDLEAAQNFIIDRTNTIKGLRDQLDPEFQIYKENQLELETLRIQADERARLGRATLFLWARSHRNLAAGISVPPMIDVMGMMRSSVSTGVKGIIP